MPRASEMEALRSHQTSYATAWDAISSPVCGRWQGVAALSCAMGLMLTLALLGWLGPSFAVSSVSRLSLHVTASKVAHFTAPNARVLKEMGGRSHRPLTSTAMSANKATLFNLKYEPKDGFELQTPHPSTPVPTLRSALWKLIDAELEESPPNAPNTSALGHPWVFWCLFMLVPACVWLARVLQVPKLAPDVEWCARYHCEERSNFAMLAVKGKEQEDGESFQQRISMYAHKGDVDLVPDPPGASSPSQSTWFEFTADDLSNILRAVELSHGSDGLVQPHPRSGCVLVDPTGARVAETFQLGQGGVRSEALAEREASGRAKGGVGYLNLEPAHGPSIGEDVAVAAMVRSGVSRVVVGILHPVPGVRGQAVAALRNEGVRVDVLGEFTSRFTSAADAAVAEALAASRASNRHLLHRVATGRPFSVFKYAMTIDGKIATTSGHSKWVTGRAARQQVWAERARSDAVVVGGTTVHRDNPNLMTRREDGHQPTRIVLSRTMDLPGTEHANCELGHGIEEGADTGALGVEAPAQRLRTNLWNTNEAPTIVMTTRGVRPEFQAELRKLGVEVVEFDELTPGAVADYCAKRGYLQLLWECGGGLAGPALMDGVFHCVMAFVAPKIIGAAGGPAQSPVGETGLKRMTDAMALRGLRIGKHATDMVITGYLPPRSATGALAEAEGDSEDAAQGDNVWTEDPLDVVEDAAALAAKRRESEKDDAMRFYKSWDVNGALSNFSPHPIDMPLMWGSKETAGLATWPTVEHFYQAQKFSGVDDPAATSTMEAIRAASSPEEAARIGRKLQRTDPRLVRPDWDTCKEGVMRAALCAKLACHAAPRDLLFGSKAAGQLVLEDSPTDAVWGVGRDGKGKNLLGLLLMELRDNELSGCPIPTGPHATKKNVDNRSSGFAGRSRRVLTVSALSAAGPAAPWQLAPQPVYAVGAAEIGNQNLSIATYVTAASISKGEGEKKKYVVCLFKDSVTHGMVLRTGRLSLSLMRMHSLVPDVVQLLGKTYNSREDNDKILKLRDMGVSCPVLWGLPVLPPELTAGTIELCVLDTMDAGDHDVLLCQVENSARCLATGEANTLTTANLKELGVL